MHCTFERKNIGRTNFATSLRQLGGPHTRQNDENISSLWVERPMGCNTNLHLVAAAIHNPRLVNSFSYANEKLILPFGYGSAAYRNKCSAPELKRSTQNGDSIPKDDERQHALRREALYISTCRNDSIVISHALYTYLIDIFVNNQIVEYCMLFIGRYYTISLS